MESDKTNSDLKQEAYMYKQARIEKLDDLYKALGVIATDGNNASDSLHCALDSIMDAIGILEDEL
jgi:hypothetical protein